MLFRSIQNKNSDMEMLDSFFGKTKYWWLLLVAGICITIVGIWMFIYPIQGYIIIAQAFGWCLLLSGIFQIVVSTSIHKKYHGWGWWLAGGIIDIIIGIILIINIGLSMEVLPLFFAFVFLFKGIENIIASFVSISVNKFLWLYLINGVLMIILSWIFFSSVNNPTFIIDFLVSIILIYWGISMLFLSFDLKPRHKLNE